jgi:hypothetical protein
MHTMKRQRIVHILIRSITWVICALLLLLCLSITAAQEVMQQQSPPQATGSLRIKTDASAVQVVMDGKEIGRTPLTIRQLSAGRHQLVLVKEGYEDYVQEVEISPVRPASLFVVMRPNNISLPQLPVEFKVIHQHRMGKCTGILTINAEALDYRAEDDEDKFHIPISTIKSVARSWGPVVGIVGINAPIDLMAFRIETPGRSYGFMALKENTEDPVAVAGARTRELFEVVYKLWSATLRSTRPKAQ